MRRLVAEIKRHGEIGLMFVDTSAAYSIMEDENANMQILRTPKCFGLLSRPYP